MALFELTELASLLQQDLDTATADLARDMATGAVVGYLGQNVESQEYTHRLPIWSDGTVRLPQRPVSAVASVTTPDDDPLDAGLWDWDGIRGRVAVDGHPEWAEVTYTAGWTTVPLPIKAVALTAAARAYTNATGVRTEQVDDYSVTYAGTAQDLTGFGLTVTEKSVLSRFRVKLSAVPT